MRKCIIFNMISLDGYIARPNGDLDWHNTDEEFNAFAEEQLAEVGELVFGRVTYDMMAAYWPTPQGIQDDPVVAKAMNSLPKLVFSTTLSSADWSNSTIIRTDPAVEIRARKELSGRDLYIFGSANLTDKLIRAGVIDEYRLMLSPVALGSGIPLFLSPVRFELIKTRPFKNGNLLLYYRPV